MLTSPFGAHKYTVLGMNLEQGRIILETLEQKNTGRSTELQSKYC